MTILAVIQEYIGHKVTSILLPKVPSLPCTAVAVTPSNIALDWSNGVATMTAATPKTLVATT